MLITALDDVVADGAKESLVNVIGNKVCHFSNLIIITIELVAMGDNYVKLAVCFHFEEDPSES